MEVDPEGVPSVMEVDPEVLVLAKMEPDDVYNWLRSKLTSKRFWQEIGAISCSS